MQKGIKFTEGLTQMTWHLCQIHSKFDAFLYKTHDKVMLVQGYQGFTSLGPYYN